MKLGKNYIRNYVISQLRFFNNWSYEDRIDIIMHGKMLGSGTYETMDGRDIFWHWGDWGEAARDAREVGRKLRANIRWFVNDLTNAIYARGLKHMDFLCDEEDLIDAAIDEEIAVANDVLEDIEGKEKEFDYYDMVNVIRLEGNPRKPKSKDDDAVTDLI